MTYWNRSKAAIIGCGYVGSATAYTLMERGLFSELVLLDVDRAKAEGEALDIAHGVPFGKPAKVYAGDYFDAADADIVVMTAGFNRKPDETRLDLVNKNVAVMKSVVEELNEHGFQGILLVVSNPVDVLTYVATKLANLPEGHVLGSGTMLDSARFKTAIADRLSFDPRNVHARIIGEHGDSELPVWSTANVSGIPIRKCFELRGIAHPSDAMAALTSEVRYGGREIIARKGATFYGIASAVRHICEAIMRDEKTIMPVSSLLDGDYGLSDVALSVPCVVGRGGVEFRVPAPISDLEQLQLDKSAASLKQIISQLDL